VRKDREKAPPSPSAPPPLIESTPPPAVSFTPEIPAPANDLSSLLADAERLRAASPQEEKSVDQGEAGAKRQQHVTYLSSRKETLARRFTSRTI